MKAARLLLLLCLVAPLSASAGKLKSDSGEERRAVILATRHNREVVVFDADTLLPLGSIRVNNLASHAALSTDGQTLFFATSQAKNEDLCCAVFALRLQSGSMCQVLFPALSTTVLPHHDQVLFQRGNTGIDVFDSRSLAPLPGIRGPGVYHLLPSPDGEWLFGITQFAGPSLDIFSPRENRMVRRLPLPSKMIWDGAWMGDLFYAFGHDGKSGQVWAVEPQETSKGPKFCKNEGTCVNRFVEIPDLQNGGRPVRFRVLAFGDSLMAYEPLAWWFKINRREGGKSFPGGIYKIDPKSGKLLAHLAGGIDFAQLISDPSQKTLYGLDPGRTYAEHRIRLVKLDPATGEVLLARPLDSDAWTITFAEIPTELVPRGEVQPRACSTVQQ